VEFFQHAKKPKNIEKIQDFWLLKLSFFIFLPFFGAESVDISHFRNNKWITTFISRQIQRITLVKLGYIEGLLWLTFGDFLFP